MPSVNLEGYVSKYVIWTVKAIILLAIFFETAYVVYSVIVSVSGGLPNLSSVVYITTEGGLFLLALLEVYSSLEYLNGQSTKSLVLVMEAELSYAVREIIILFHSGRTDLSSLGSVALIILALGITLIFSSRNSRDNWRMYPLMQHSATRSPKSHAKHS